MIDSHRFKCIIFWIAQTKLSLMNKLQVNGSPVLARYLPYEGKGSILQLYIQPAAAAPALHCLIYQSLKRWDRFKDGGLMEAPELEMRDDTFPGLYFSEIRILGWSVLYLVDHLRQHGFAVIEDAP